jgi:DNA-binding CsgD family transcriptional regulator
MLDLVATPLLVVNGQGRLISTNTYGRVALELRDGIALVDGQVCAQALRSNGRLQALISDVAAAAGQGQYRAQALSLSRGADRRPLGLTLRPLRPRSSWDHLGGAGAESALVVIDLSALDLQDPPRPWLLQDLFNLTPAEASLLHALMQDKRIEDHAQARGVSVTTVRTQLAHLFRKTGTNRQSELVRMASRAVGGLRVDDDEPDGR